MLNIQQIIQNGMEMDQLAAKMSFQYSQSIMEMLKLIRQLLPQMFFTQSSHSIRIIIRAIQVKWGIQRYGHRRTRSINIFLITMHIISTKLALSELITNAFFYVQFKWQVSNYNFHLFMSLIQRSEDN